MVREICGAKINPKSSFKNQGAQNKRGRKLREQILCLIISLYTKIYLISFTNFNAQFFYSLTICMLHHNPRHVSSINMPIFRRTNCIITASGIVALCKRLQSRPDETRLQISLLSSSVLCSRLQRATITDAVIIQFVLLKMGMLMLEICEDCDVTYILLKNKRIVH